MHHGPPNQNFAGPTRQRPHGQVYLQHGGVCIVSDASDVTSPHVYDLS